MDVNPLLQDLPLNIALSAKNTHVILDYLSGRLQNVVLLFNPTPSHYRICKYDQKVTI